jgi:muconolactone delta-isomerase
LGNQSKKYPVDNALRNVVYETSTTSNVYDAAKDFFFQLFIPIDWKGHLCFRVKKTYRIPQTLFGIHLFGDIVLGPRPQENNDRTVLSLHKYAHLIIDEQLRPLFKTAEEIQALKLDCGPSCIELIIRNKLRRASTRATPVIAFKLENGEYSSIITAGSSAYIQYVSYAETVFESDRYISLLTPIDGNGDNDDEEESLLVVKAVDIVMEDIGMEQEQQIAAAIASEEKERTNEFQAKEKARLSLLNRLAGTHQTLDLFATKLADELMVDMKNVYPDLDQSIATNLTQALKLIEDAKGKLKAVKKMAANLAAKSDHLIIESQNFRVTEVVEVKLTSSNFRHVMFPKLNQKNDWGPADSDRSQKQIAKQFTVIFNNVAHLLSQLLSLASEKVPDDYMSLWTYNCETYWKDFLQHPNCRFGSLKNFLRFMRCCVLPVTKNTKDFNLFLDMEPKLKADKRMQEFHLHFWEAICQVANSYALDNNARLFIAPSYADFEHAVKRNKLQSILVRKNRDAVGHGDMNEDEDEEDQDKNDDDCVKSDEENQNEDEGSSRSEEEDRDDEDEAVVDEEFKIEYVTGCSPNDLLPKEICKHLDLIFREILKNRNNLFCYTQCAAIGCINVIDESKGVCPTCKVSKFCTVCSTRRDDVCCQTCNYLVDESGWIKAFPSLSNDMDESCWQKSKEMINDDPIFPKTTNGKAKAWPTLTQDEIDNYADVSKTTTPILKIFGDDNHILYGSTMFRIMHEKCWISESTHDAIVAIMNDSYSQYYVDQLLRDDASSSSNHPVKVHKYLNVC